MGKIENAKNRERSDSMHHFFGEFESQRVREENQCIQCKNL